MIYQEWFFFENLTFLKPAAYLDVQLSDQWLTYHGLTQLLVSIPKESAVQKLD